MRSDGQRRPTDDRRRDTRGRSAPTSANARPRPTHPTKPSHRRQCAPCQKPPPPARARLQNPTRTSSRSLSKKTNPPTHAKPAATMRAMPETPPPSPCTLAKSDQNLVWLDCEMTGLTPDTDRLLEIAVVVTGPN